MSCSDGRRDSKSARFVAVDFEELDLQHDFAAGLFELFDQFTGKGEPLRVSRMVMVRCECRYQRALPR